MQFLSSKLFLLAGLILLPYLNIAEAAFSDMDCLNATFSTEVSHKALMGLSQNELKIEKNACLVTVSQTRFKFMKKTWAIDVCRGPVHIKYGQGSIDVLKRGTSCGLETSPSEFCKSMNTLFEIMQDDGLIFAKGEKEELVNDHGRVYCSFLVLKKYLEDGFVLSRHDYYDNFIVKGMGRPQVEETPAAPPVSPTPIATPASTSTGTSSSGAADY